MVQKTIPVLMRPAICLVTYLCACGGSLAATIYPNGTSGSWDDGANWKGGVAPGKDDMLYYNTSYFSPAGDRPVTLSLDGKTHYLYRFYMDMGSKTAIEPDPSPLTLLGPGKLYLQAANALYHQIQYGREVTFDHVDFVLTNHLATGTTGGGLMPYGKLTVRGGRIEATADGSYVTVSASSSLGTDGTLVVEDGAVIDTRQFTLSDKATVFLNDGTIRFADANQDNVITPNLHIGANSRYLSLGTRARYWTQGIIPQGTNSLVVVNHRTYSSVQPPLTADARLAWRGALMVTNAPPTGETPPQVAFTNSVSIYGRGRLAACRLIFASDLVSDVDLSRIDVGYNFGSHVYANRATVNFHDVAFGRFRGNVGATTPGWDTSNINLCFHGRTVFDFTDKTAPSEPVSHTDSPSTYFMKERSSIVLCGGGTYAQALEEMPTRFEAYEIGEGVNVTQRSSDHSFGSSLRVRDFKMEPNSSYASGVHGQDVEAFGDVSIDPSAKIVHASYKATNNACWPAFRSLETEPPTTNLTLTAMPDNYSLYWVGGSAFYANATDITSGFANSYGYWLDAGPDCNFSTSGNWGRNTLYKTGVNMTLCGKFHTVVTNDVDDIAVPSLILGAGGGANAGSAPFIVRGKPIRVTRTDVPVYSGSSLNFSTLPAVSTPSAFPQILEVRIDSDEDTMYVGTCTSGDRRGALYFKGGILAPNARFAPIGSIVLGGTVSVRDFNPQEAVVSHTVRRTGNVKRFWTEVMLKPGCAMTVSAQESANSAAAVLAIMTNAALTVNGPWIWNATNTEHVVRGVFAVNGTLGGDAEQGYFGKGSLKVKTTDGAAGGKLRIGEGLTLEPTSADWGTMPLEVTDDATVLNDLENWTYPVASGIAVKRPGHTLAFDGTGTTIVGGPISGHDIVVAKKGRGTLVLAGASDGLTNSTIEVSAGALAWTGRQRIGTLRVASGATLKPGAADGAIEPLEVAGDVELSGVTVRLADADAQGAATSWTSILTVPAGAKITGEPVADGLRLRLVTNDQGGTDLQGKSRLGMVLIVR